MMTRTPVPNEFKGSTNGGWRDEPASDKQRTLIAKLAAGRQLEPDHIDFVERQLARGDQLLKGYASEIIDRLFALPCKPKGEPEVKLEKANIEPGRYALRHPDDELNPIRFYRVQAGKGRWEGRTFLSRFASDEAYPVRGAERQSVLQRLQEDPHAAARLYSQEAKCCSNCGRGLTRRLSRAIGMGPVCAGKSSWITEEMISEATADLIAAGLDPQEELQD